VLFESGSKEENRPMQGQSPYLINAGIFYQSPKTKLNAAILYNRIGKRIIGVGRSVGTTGSENTNNIPNSYEMPHNSLDLSLGKKIGKWEIKANIRDLLAERIYFKQFAKVTEEDGTKTEYQEITKQYKPGRNFGLNLSYNF
jgi:outer membrane receptor protein involved in Fe transport